MSFLDALLLFAQTRKTVAMTKPDSALAKNLESILLTLPLVYAGDDIWGIEVHGESDGGDKSAGHLLALIDRCLGLNTRLSGRPQFPVAERVLGIQWLRWQMDLWRGLHPRALKTRSAQVGFTAWHFDWGASATLHLAFSPFEPAIAASPDLRTALGQPVDERAWSWAWHNFRIGDLSQQPTEETVEDHWRSLQKRSA